MRSVAGVTTRTFWFVLFVATFSSCKAAPVPAMSDPAAFGAVRDALAEFCAAYEARDIDRVMQRYSESIKPTVFGLGHGDRSVGRDEIRAQVARDWETTQSAALRIGWNDVVVVGNYAAILGECTFVTTAADAEQRLAGRFSMSLVRESDRWRIAHLHASVP